ncbi:hypothetical protein WA026_004976 [Henosepilachna vigintioctopunctata]|uniref:Uncharacterized protein n=1 Tax=Henosepilachna vigintioctopunctata TaxID=420089 RepID=A0AAW1UW22_9CUCU
MKSNKKHAGNSEDVNGFDLKKKAVVQIPAVDYKFRPRPSQKKPKKKPGKKSGKKAGKKSGKGKKKKK